MPAREVFSLLPRFLTKQCSLEEFQDWVNQYLKDVCGRHSDLCRLSGASGSDAAEKLLSHLKGHEPTWFAPCVSRISLGQRNWAPATTIQVEYIQGLKLDELEKQATEFCEGHEATDIKVKREDAGWIIVIEHAVA